MILAAACLIVLLFLSLVSIIFLTKPYRRALKMSRYIEIPLTPESREALRRIYDDMNRSVWGDNPKE